MRKDFSSILQPRMKYLLHGWGIAGLVAISVAVAAFILYQEREKIEETDARVQLFQSRLAKAVKKPKRDDAEEQKRWKELAEERAFPWELIFGAIERTATPEIAVLEFLPDRRTGHVILRGEAKNLKALMAYVDALARERGLTRVYLAHQQPTNGDKLQTVGFEIQASAL